jgi:hypothetical protein
MQATARQHIVSSSFRITKGKSNKKSANEQTFVDFFDVLPFFMAVSPDIPSRHRSRGTLSAGSGRDGLR